MEKQEIINWANSWLTRKISDIIPVGAIPKTATFGITNNQGYSIFFTATRVYLNITGQGYFRCKF